MSDQPTSRKAKDPADTRQQPTSNLYWMGRVDSTLASIIEKLELLRLENSENWAGLMKWRCDVDEKLKSQELKIQSIEQSVDTLTTELERSQNVAKLERTQNAAKTTTQQEQKQIDFQWVVEKLLLPLTIAGLTWFALTILPRIIASLPTKP